MFKKILIANRGEIACRIAKTCKKMGIATIAYDKMNDDEMALKYVKKALQAYTDQGNYAGVALAAQKLKHISP